MRQERIGSRVPFLVVDAIEDDEQRVLTPPQKIIQPAPLLRRGDFARVTRAYGGDGVGMRDTSLEAIDVAIKFDAVGIEVILRQIGQRIIESAKHALIREIMDGENGAWHVKPAFLKFL